MNNAKSYFSNLRSQVKKVGEKKIVEKRAALASNILRKIIMSSPVYTGTYANAHTVYINGNALRRPVVYFFTPEADPNYRLQSELFMKKKALLGVESFEVPHLRNARIEDKISIGFDEAVVYWGGDYYVESKYAIYEEAKRMYSAILSGEFISKRTTTTYSFRSVSGKDGIELITQTGSKTQENEYDNTAYFKAQYKEHSDENIERLIAKIEGMKYNLLVSKG